MGTTTLLSFEEFERLPNEPGKDELLNGEWIHLPPAFINQMDIVHRVFALLTSMAKRDEGPPRPGLHGRLTGSDGYIFKAAR